jgi:photosystem II stability/assembly factor-like uncharacterized protein
MLALLALALLLPSARAAAAAPGVTLFAAYAGYPPCFRQPLVVALNASALVVFAEGRNNSYCSGAADGSNSSIHSRFSADGGATWSPPQELLHAPPQPDYLSAVANPATGSVHLFVQSAPNVQLTSRDGGATWSAPAPVKVALPAGYTATPGVASGIVLDGALCAEPTCGGAAGRLVVAWVCHKAKAPGARRAGDVSCAGCFSCLATSDDDGDTWAISAVTTQEGSREAALAQLAAAAVPGAPGAVVYASERNMGAAPGARWHAVSADSGKTFSRVGNDPALPDGDTKNWTGICAGLARGGAGTLLFSTPTAAGARADLGLFRSTDEGASWSPGALFAAGPAGYSDLTAVNATHAAIIFENGADEFAQQINFAVVAFEG